MTYVIHHDDLSADELTEMALAEVGESTVPISAQLGWVGHLPVVRVAFPKNTCIPQTPVHKTLQKHYDMVTYTQVTIGGVTAVSYMHRDNYDFAVESTLEADL